MSKPYWLVSTSFFGERVYWDDTGGDDGGWVDREEATEAPSKLVGQIMRDRARLHEFASTTDTAWGEGRYNAVYMTRRTRKEHVEKEEPATGDDHAFQMICLQNVFLQPHVPRISSRTRGHSAAYDLAWDLRVAYVAEQEKNARMTIRLRNVYELLTFLNQEGQRGELRLRKWLEEYDLLSKDKGNAVTA